jgi:hypothetical protein
VQDMRSSQLEREVDRLREAVNSRDARISELEKQKQGDRHRLHELREKLDASERSVLDAQANTELEQTQKKMLENRVRMLEQSVRASRDFHEQNSKKSRKSKSIEDDNNDVDDDELNVSNTSLTMSTGSLLLSPRTSKNANSSANPMSPIDRVSAALASRAAAESSKNALRQATQLRMGNQQGPAVPTTVVPASSARAGATFPGSEDLYADPYYDNPDDDDEADVNENDVNEQLHSSMGSLGSVSSMSRQQRPTAGGNADNSPQHQQLLQSSATAQRQASSNPAAQAGPQSVEDSISKTQSFLQRRLAAQARMAAITQQQQSLPQQLDDDDNENDRSQSNSTGGLAPAASATDAQSYLQAALSASALASAAFEKHTQSMKQEQQYHKQIDVMKSKSAKSLPTRFNNNEASNEGDDNNEQDDGNDGLGNSLSAPSLLPAAPSGSLLDGSSVDDDDEQQQQYLNYLSNMATSGNDGSNNIAKKKKGKKVKKSPATNDGELATNSVSDSASLGEGSFLPKIANLSNKSTPNTSGRPSPYASAGSARK